MHRSRKRQEDARRIRVDALADSEAELPYLVQTWPAAAAAPTRIVGRATTQLLARAIYQAALDEFADVRLVLTLGQKIIEDSGPRDS